MVTDQGERADRASLVAIFTFLGALLGVVKEVIAAIRK